MPQKIIKAVKAWAIIVPHDGYLHAYEEKNLAMQFRDLYVMYGHKTQKIIPVLITPIKRKGKE